MEGFSFVTPVTGLNRPNTGKEDDDDEVKHFISRIAINMDSKEQNKVLHQEYLVSFKEVNYIFISRSLSSKSKC
jgi:hypothetical protein